MVQNSQVFVLIVLSGRLVLESFGLQNITCNNGVCSYVQRSGIDLLTVFRLWSSWIGSSIPVTTNGNEMVMKNECKDGEIWLNFLFLTFSFAYLELCASQTLNSYFFRIKAGLYMFTDLCASWNVTLFGAMN